MRIALSVSFFVFSLTVNYAQVNNGPVARYSFNSGTAQDEVGNNDAKTYGVILAEDRFGNSKSAYYLNGGYGSYLNLGTSSMLKPSSGTISLWFYIENPVYSGKGVEFNPIILTKCHEGDDFFEGYTIFYDLNSKKIGATTTYSELNQVSTRSIAPIKVRQWYHVAMTYDDEYLCLYLNGLLENKMAKNFRSHFLSTDSIMIGNSANSKNHRFFNGYIDDIAIYNRVLSEGEIMALYKAPNPNTPLVIRKWIFISMGLLAIIGITIWLARLRYKYILRQQKRDNALVLKSLEQEIKLLKGQMNPHFIFNSLNAIQQFIIINENDKAQLYLSKFSRLIRKLLESNTRDTINLIDEIDILEKYLEIESLRFDHVFKPVIEVSPEIAVEKTFIPLMMIQPFIENAIWHGLMPLEGDKKLSIKFDFLNENALYCTIDDNGIGRQPKKETDLKKTRPLGIQFIQQRLELLSKIYNMDYSVHIIDKLSPSGKSEGTKIVLTLPVFKN